MSKPLQPLLTQAGGSIVAATGFGGSTDGRQPPAPGFRSALTIRPLLQQFSSSSDVPGVPFLVGTDAIHCTVHGPSRISLRCPGLNGTSHWTPGPRCQRRQLRTHNQPQADLTVRTIKTAATQPVASQSAATQAVAMQSHAQLGPHPFGAASRLSRSTPGAMCSGLFGFSPAW